MKTQLKIFILLIFLWDINISFAEEDIKSTSLISGKDLSIYSENILIWIIKEIYLFVICIHKDLASL